MPKRQKEKQYQSAREHRRNQTLRAGGGGVGSSGSVGRPLPFDCCALTLTPFSTPVCNPDGIMFDNTAIVPHVMKYGTDPVTGKPMTSRDIIVLNMDREESTGRWQCPVLNRPFNDRTKVVAIRHGNEANVISHEAYRELNVKAKNYLDLITGEKFTKDQVITLQDPENEAHCKLRDIGHFSHTLAQREENARQQNSSAASNVKHSVTASRIMDKLDKEKRKRERAAEDRAKKLLQKDTSGADEKPSTNMKDELKIYTDELLTSMNLTSGKASGSLTSTAMGITRENKARLATEEEIIESQCEQMKRLKKKGMVRMCTNRGAMDIELHCDIVPRTAMNFLLLAARGEYDGSKFHRSIPNFMIQGGKKPGVAKGSDNGDGGSSAWEKPFPDEFDDRLTHSGGGVVSMANSGPGTNGRQFFVTYKSCSHLDRKHSVFGKVVGGLEILRNLERIPTDGETDRPLETVKIESMEILDDPVAEALEIERERILARKEEKCEAESSRKSSALGRSTIEWSAKSRSVLPPPKAIKNDGDGNEHAPISIGKYLKVAKNQSKKRKKSDIGVGSDNGAVAENADAVSRLPPPPKKTTFGDFSGW